MSVWWWKEYPERDTEYVRWYPANIAPLNANKMWTKPIYKEKMGIYLHVPFCEDICPFCPYNKFKANDKKILEYVNSVIKEMEMYSKYVTTDYVSFIYFGGGSPSAMNPHQVELIMSALKRFFPITSQTEVSMEVNPVTSDEKIIGFKEAGINRVSLGVQSFNQSVLDMLGSHHTVEDTRRIIKTLRDSGIDNIGIDLLFNLPNQTMQDWKDELKEAIELGIVHMSTYSMILDEHSPLTKKIKRGEIPDQGDDQYSMEMSRFAMGYLSENNLNHYASCASSGHDFAVKGFESRYEVDHWGAPQIDYIGLGPGAYGFVNNHIYCNIHTTKEYYATVDNGTLPVVAGKKLNREDEMSRFMVLGMKCISVKKKDFIDEFGIKIEEVFGEQIEKLKSWGLVEVTEHEIRCTDKGRLYVDNISKAFYNEENYKIPQPLEFELQVLSQSGKWKRPLLEEINI